MHAASPKAPRRRSFLAAPALATAAFAAQGCENIPPFLERNYVQFGTTVLFEDLKAEQDSSHGPFPALTLTGGTLLEVEGTSATAVEGEFQAYWLDPGGELDGYGFRYLAGARWFWNMDGRWRPSAGLGGGWMRGHIEDHDDDFDPSGPLGYADASLDWMITPRHALGTRVRGSLRYEQADHENGIRPGIEISLQSVWRF
jgi:hypothetical protein